MPVVAVEALAMAQRDQVMARVAVAPELANLHVLAWRERGRRGERSQLLCDPRAAEDDVGRRRGEAQRTDKPPELDARDGAVLIHVGHRAQVGHGRTGAGDRVRQREA